MCNFYWLQAVACKADQQFKKESCGVDSRSSLGVGFGGGGDGGGVPGGNVRPLMIYYSVGAKLYYHHHLCFSMALGNPSATQQTIKPTMPAIGEKWWIPRGGLGGAPKKKATRQLRNGQGTREVAKWDWGPGGITGELRGNYEGIGNWEMGNGKNNIILLNQEIFGIFSARDGLLFRHRHFKAAGRKTVGKINFALFAGWETM